MPYWLFVASFDKQDVRISGKTSKSLSDSELRIPRIESRSLKTVRNRRCSLWLRHSAPKRVLDRNRCRRFRLRSGSCTRCWGEFRVPSSAMSHTASCCSSRFFNNFIPGIAVHRFLEVLSTIGRGNGETGNDGFIVAIWARSEAVSVSQDLCSRHAQPLACGFLRCASIQL